MGKDTGNSAKILVIDDEEDVVDYITTFLEDHGYQTFAAKSGDSALRQVERVRPDIITLDITMPEKSGVRFLREIQSNPDMAHIPVIVITGMRKEFQPFIHTRQQVKPPDGYLEKPFDRDQLLALIDDLLKKNL